MPIVTIEYIKKNGETIEERKGKLNECTNRIGEILGSASGNVWAKFYEIDYNNYSENGMQGDEYFPIFITILLKNYKKGKAIILQTKRICSALSEIYNRSEEQIHITYEPSAKGRIAFGGTLLT